MTIFSALPFEINPIIIDKLILYKSFLWASLLDFRISIKHSNAMKFSLRNGSLNKLKYPFICVHN